jgi:hypothetical protein
VSTLTSWDYEPGDGATATRLWLSEQQWMSLLTRVQRDADDYAGPNRRDPHRDRMPARLRVVVRAQQPDGRSATYLVRSHNISAGGIGFVHSRPMPRGSRCTIAIEGGDGQGLITSGRVAWGRQIDDHAPAAFEVGIQFDRPIDPTPFGGDPTAPCA